MITHSRVVTIVTLAGISLLAAAQAPPQQLPPPPVAEVTPVPGSAPGGAPGAFQPPPGAGAPPGVPGAMPPPAAPPAAMPGAPASARPSYVVPEPSSGLPPGRLLPLPIMPEKLLRELAIDLGLHLEITAGYKRVSMDAVRDLPPIPASVSPAVVLVRESAGAKNVVRLGFIMPPRRLPQLWVQGFTMQGARAVPNPDADPATLDVALKQIIAERKSIFGKLRLTDLAVATIPLSYVDSDAALFALRAMGYSAITESEPLAKDDSYKGEDVEVFEYARPGPPDAAATAAAAAAAAQPPAPQVNMTPEDQKRFLPKFPAIKNLPTTIALDRLPLIVKMPSTEARNMGIVGGELTPAQRDALGLTVIPSAASPLAETVAGGVAELLVVYHPGYPDQLGNLKKLIDDTIDKPARQVFIEGLVLEISSEGLRDLGVQWDMKKGNWSFSLGSLISVPPGGSTFGFIRDASNVTPTTITAKVNALVQQKKAEILSRPSVITLDNRQATIRVGTDIPVATSKDAGAAGSGSSRVAFSFQYIPTGILLNVRPRISDDLQEISMLIDATVSATVPGADLQVLDPSTKIALASAPTISTRRVQTYARIRDNQPLIIGGLLSRNQVKESDRVPGLGELPFVGGLFGHTNVQDDRREVIIVLTPSVVTENIRETKATYPKDDERFDLIDTALFKEHYRIKAEDLVDSSDIRFNARFLAYRNIANKLIDQHQELATKPPFSLFNGTKIPGEFIFVTGMMYQMLSRLNAGDPIRFENLKFFELLPDGERRPVTMAEILARYGDGKNPNSFFDANRGKALALSFRLARSSMAASDMFTETTPEVRLVDCPDRDTWHKLLWDMNQNPPGGVPRFTILINDPSDLRRLQLAYATQNTVLNNGGGSAQIFDRWLVGRMLHLQEVRPNWERIMNGQIAQYFFIGQYYYMYFMYEHQKALQSLEAALRTPEIATLLEGTKLP